MTHPQTAPAAARVASRFPFLLCGLLLLLPACSDDASGVKVIDHEGDAETGSQDGGNTGPDPDLGATPRRDAESAPFDDAAPVDDAAPIELPDASDAIAVPPQIFAVETRLGAPSTPAGQTNRITCEALDADGVPAPGILTAFEIRPSEGWRLESIDDGIVTGLTAGPFSVTCTIPGLGLRDATPARWDVLPGPAASVTAEVWPEHMVAGETAEVECAAFDLGGNRVSSADARVEVFPSGEGVEVDGREVTITRAGRYRVDCVVPGARSKSEVVLVVVPDVPAQLVAAVDPDRPFHDVGAVVGYEARVIDQYGNRIDDAPLEWSSAPALPGFGEGRYRPDREGRFTLRVEVVGPTHEDRPLAATAEILVASGGPSIVCTDPPPGSMLGLGGAINLRGRVENEIGIRAVTVDGQQVAIGADGSFTARVQPRWGLNVHQITARDAADNVNSAFCDYFASDRYHDEDAPLNDTVLLHMAQSAVDDGPPDRPLRSLTDLLRRVVDSPGLLATIDQQLRANNPVVPNECRQRVLGVCVFRLGAEYRGARIRGPNTMSASLVQGGLRLTARLSRIELDVRMQGTVTNSGTIFAEFVEVTMTFDIRLNNGRPEVRLRRTDSVNVGRLSSDFNGFLTGWLLDLVFSAFERTIRNEVTGAIRGFLEGQIDVLLSDVLRGLDLDSLGLAFQVPGFTGGPATNLAFGLAFSTLDVSQTRIRLGIATRVTGPTRQAARSAGVPLPPGPVRIELAPNGNLGAGVNLGLVNQFLHRLWRAGVFHLDDAGALFGGLPEGTELSFRVLLPPAAVGVGAGDRVRIDLGPAVGTFHQPGLFDEPLRLRIAASASAAVSLHNGTEIRFGGAQGITIDALHVMIEGATMSPQQRAVLERDLRRILQAVLNGALNDALPALPVPDFALPDSLVPYGVAAGTRLGLRGATLRGTISHFLLDGTFRQ